MSIAISASAPTGSAPAGSVPAGSAPAAELQGVLIAAARLSANQLSVCAVLVEADQRPVERAGGVVAAGIDDQSPPLAEPPNAGGLVDVTVQAHQGLAL